MFTILKDFLGNESEMFNKIKRELAKSMKPGEEWILLGNISVTNQLDAILIRPNSIAVIEIKGYSGDVVGHENGNWYCSKERRKITINEGRENPFEQVRKYRGNVVDKIKRAGDFLGQQRSADLRDKWIQFVSGLIVFDEMASFDSDIDFNKALWFRVTDVLELSEKIREIGHRTMELDKDEIMAIATLLAGGLVKLIEAKTPDPHQEPEVSTESEKGSTSPRPVGPSIEVLGEMGFSESRFIGELFSDLSMIPDKPGVYVVVCERRVPSFIIPGTGGGLPRRDPNVTISELEGAWVKSADVVYIGQTDRSLKKRISAYMKFGQGKDVPHHGGRYIWQIQDSKGLMVRWKELDGNSEGSKEVERRMMERFVDEYGKLPFANLRR